MRDIVFVCMCVCVCVCVCVFVCVLSIYCIHIFYHTVKNSGVNLTMQCLYNSHHVSVKLTPT